MNDFHKMYDLVKDQRDELQAHIIEGTKPSDLQTIVNRQRVKWGEMIQRLEKEK